MVVEVRRAEPSDAKAIKGIYECPNAYTGTLQLPLPSSDMWENVSRIFQSTFMHMWQ
ncbi:acetyltransferase [Vibrio cholerae]|nr:acetyltransferase [Vibrio cholerae]